MCLMYGKPRYTSTNQLRCDTFTERYQPQSDQAAFKIGNGVDLSLLPPCRKSLELHVLRANYVTYIWKHAHVANPPELTVDNKSPSAIGRGWEFDTDGGLSIQWTYEDHIMPLELADVLAGSTDSQPPLPSESSDDITDDYDDIEEDDEVENILDIIFGADEDEDE